MMVGHAAVAFVLGALLARYWGFAPERALLVGFAAGAFAVVPDVDMGYALVGIATSFPTDLSSLQSTFWDSGLEVHRGLTHSLVIGAVGAVGFGAIAHRGAWRVLGGALLAGLLVATPLYAGLLAVGVMTSFLAAGVVVVYVALTYDVSPRSILAAALLGILSHPFGDIFTGTAPQLFYPFDLRVLPSRVLLSADPTIHLLSVFALELLVIWLAVDVYLRLRGERLWPHVHRRAVLGAGYAAVVLAVPPPTLDVSYHFVFSILAVSVVGVVDLPVPDLQTPEGRRVVGLTALTAVSVALLAYTGAYVVLHLDALL